MREGLPLSWHDSGGWIVLSGRADPLSEIRALALSRHSVGGAVAYIADDEDRADGLMEDLAELGAPAGYLVDLAEGDNNEIYERLSAAGMVVVSAEELSDRFRQLATHTVSHALREALQRGAVIMFEGAAAGLAGEFAAGADGNIAGGLKLVSNALFLPGVGSIVEDAQAFVLRRDLPEATLIGLEEGAALVLGPDQRIETWGEGRVTISLSDLRREPMFQEPNIAGE